MYKKRNLFLMVVGLVFGAFAWLIFQPTPVVISNKPFKQQISEDFDYLFNLIKTEYPLLEAQKQATGYDFVADYEKHKAHVMLAKNSTEFFFLLNDVLGKLDNEHTHMMTKADIYHARAIYGQSEESNFRGQIYQKLTRDPILRKVYETEIGMTKEQEAEQRKQKIAQIGAQKSQPAQPFRNNEFFTLIPNQVAYLSIKEMMHLSLLDSDEQKQLMDFLRSIKDYQALIIDIRGNQGGDTRYWSRFLLPAIVNKPLSLNLYSFFKQGEQMDVYRANRATVTPIDRANVAQNFTAVKDILDKFTYQEIQPFTVQPAENGIKFTGKIYLLVDENVYSSAETLAIFAKHTKFATLIGSQTKGDGIGTDAMIVVLPNTHFALRYTKQLGIAPDGTPNAIWGTTPDVMVKNTSQATLLDAKSALSDQVVKKAIELAIGNK